MIKLSAAQFPGWISHIAILPITRTLTAGQHICGQLSAPWPFNSTRAKVLSLSTILPLRRGPVTDRSLALRQLLLPPRRADASSLLRTPCVHSKGPEGIRFNASTDNPGLRG